MVHRQRVALLSGYPGWPQERHLAQAAWSLSVLSLSQCTTSRLAVRRPSAIPLHHCAGWGSAIGHPGKHRLTLSMPLLPSRPTDLSFWVWSSGTPRQLREIARRLTGAPFITVLDSTGKHFKEFDYPIEDTVPIECTIVVQQPVITVNALAALLWCEGNPMVLLVHEIHTFAPKCMPCCSLPKTPKKGIKNSYFRFKMHTLFPCHSLPQEFQKGKIRTFAHKRAILAIRQTQEKKPAKHPNHLSFKPSETTNCVIPLLNFSETRREMVLDLRGHTYCCGSERGLFSPVVVLPIWQVEVYSRHFSVQLCYVQLA